LRGIPATATCSPRRRPTGGSFEFTASFDAADDPYLLATETTAEFTAGNGNGNKKGEQASAD